MSKEVVVEEKSCKAKFDIIDNLEMEITTEQLKFMKYSIERGHEYGEMSDDQLQLAIYNRALTLVTPKRDIDEATKLAQIFVQQDIDNAKEKSTRRKKLVRKVESTKLNMKIEMCSSQDELLDLLDDM